MARQQRRVHAEDSLLRERDERLADELRPADDEDQLRQEFPDRVQRLQGIDVTCLDQRRVETRGELVERALARAVRVDRAGRVTIPTISAPTSAAASRQSRPIVSKLTQTVRIAAAMLPGGGSVDRGRQPSVAAALDADPAVPAEPHEEAGGARREDHDHDRACAGDVQQLDPGETEHAREEQPETLLRDRERQATANQYPGDRASRSQKRIAKSMFPAAQCAAPAT